ncbi:hypothetical protein DL89DRAFT_265810, partial [Linderina pennispora]
AAIAVTQMCIQIELEKRQESRCCFLRTCLGADFPCHAGGRARNRRDMQTYSCAVDGRVGHWPG